MNSHSAVSRSGLVLRDAQRGLQSAEWKYKKLITNVKLGNDLAEGGCG